MLREFLSFIRIRICLYVASIGIVGHLLYNPSSSIVPAALAAFFLAASVYSFNTVTDREEDRLNGRVNSFAGNGAAISFVLFFIGLSFSYAVSFQSFVVYIMASAAGLAYSALRLKRCFPFKNVYTIAVTLLAFLIGASSDRVAIHHMALLSAIIASVSILGDMRDIEGDRKVGIKTVSSHFGEWWSRALVYILSATFIFGAAVSGTFQSASPFMAAGSLSLKNWGPGKSQFFMMAGTAAVAAALVMS